ncbi:hypothetical protein D3C75_558770 [compost metagenome]
MPVTPCTPTFDKVLCQPTVWSIKARRPSARAVAYAVALAFFSVSQTIKSGQITISSRWLKLSRYLMASEIVLQPHALTYPKARRLTQTEASATATSCESSPGTPRMRGFTPVTASAVNSALMPVYLPLASLPPMMLEIVSAWATSSSSSTPSATRTTTVTGLHWSAMACKEAARVPLFPALPMAACTLVIKTGSLRGKVAASASLAVHTMPIIAVETVEITRVPSLISTTCTPW